MLEDAAAWSAPGCARRGRTSWRALGGAGHRRRAAGPLRPPACANAARQRRGLRGYMKNEACGPHPHAADRLAQATGRRLRLDLPGARRHVQHRRRPDRQTTAACARTSTCGRVRRLLRRAPDAGDLMRRRHAGGRAQGRAAALLARRRALVAPRPAGHRRGRRQHLRLHRRRHRQGDGDRPAGRRGDRPAHRDEAVRAPLRGALHALKPRFALYEKRRARQPPPLADRPGDLARPAQPPHPAPHERRARRDAEPGRLLSWRGITKLMFT
jgi:hypothetical protein